jgi:hypothetical protein
MTGPHNRRMNFPKAIFWREKPVKTAILEQIAVKRFR